jgi:hypothetical protein
VSETTLVGGDMNLVVRVGDTVRRPMGRWSPGVHALLLHFETVGFDGARRYLGVDEQEREVLSYVEDDAALAPAWGLPSDRRGERLRRLCDGYGLERGDVVERVLAFRRRRYELTRNPRILRGVCWLEEHQKELEAWL